MNPTRQLARFVERTRWSDLPAPVQHEATRAFVNWVGCALGGATHSVTGVALAALGDLSSPGRCTILGRRERTDPLNAALLNGLSASAHAFDDTHLATIAHPTAPTVAALLAYAEMHPVSGANFLTALILANEVQCRLSCALTVAPARCHLGLYMTGMTGAAGVAAGVGRLMGLTEQQLAWAIGIGAIQGGGFRASHGTMCGSFIPGNAGRNGLLAAHLARGNFNCHEDALAGKNGFLQVFGQPANVEALTDGLGSRYECMNVVAKPFPAGVFIHPLIDACLQLTGAGGFAAQDIERIELQVHELGLGLTGKTEPQHAYDAQVSVYHWAAAVLHTGRAGLFESSDACVHDPAVAALRKRVAARVGDDLQADEARVAVTLRDGRRFEAAALPCVGSARRPMSDEQMQAKFVAQATDSIGEAQARRLVAHCWNLRTADDVSRAAPGFWGEPNPPRP